MRVLPRRGAAAGALESETLKAARSALPVYVLAECAGRVDPTDLVVAALDRAGIEDESLADDTVSREKL